MISLVILAGAAGGYYYWQQSHGSPRTMTADALGTPFATRSANGLTVNFYHAEGGLKFAANEVTIEFRDAASGEAVDVGTIKLDLDMNMPNMVMHSGSSITPAGSPGRYLAKIKPDMAGDWMAQLRYNGPHGTGSLSFAVNVKP